MKKIVPFNNVLTFNTDVCEITAISLEHNIEIDSDVISGEFYISGEYKMTDGQLEREEFNFELPFDIALGSNYNIDSLLVDIDDFRYELIERNKLKVNIDLYIDGEIIEESIMTDTENIENGSRMLDTFDGIYSKIEENMGLDLGIDNKSEIIIDEEQERCITDEESEPIKKENYENKIQVEKLKNNEEDNYKKTNDYFKDDEPIQMPIIENLDLLDEMLEGNKEKKMKEENVNDTNINIDNSNEQNNQEVNIFNGFNEDERYVTYRVYRVMEGDTVDKILEKYSITKEELSKYNSIEIITPGDKLIIPANDK